VARYYVNGREVGEAEFRGDAEAARSRLHTMFLLQSPPSCNTDATFLTGHCNGSQFDGQEYIGDYYRREALAAGVDPKGKVYLGGLARYPGDPEAWVSGRGDVRRVVEGRGWGCQGSVNVKARPLQPERPGPAVAEDIVEAKVAERLAGVPAGERVDVEAVKESVLGQLKPHWSR
jgi:hypothetical protein